MKQVVIAAVIGAARIPWLKAPLFFRETIGKVVFGGMEVDKPQEAESMMNWANAIVGR